MCVLTKIVYELAKWRRHCDGNTLNNFLLNYGTRKSPWPKSIIGRRREVSLFFLFNFKLFSLSLNWNTGKRENFDFLTQSAFFTVKKQSFNKFSLTDHPVTFYSYAKRSEPFYDTFREKRGRQNSMMWLRFLNEPKQYDF